MTKIIVVSLHTLKFSGFKVAVQGSVEERPVTFTLVNKSDTEIMNVLFINQVSFFFLRMTNLHVILIKLSTRLTQPILFPY